MGEAEVKKPAIGMRVRFTRDDHKFVEKGREGTIDCISKEDDNQFWVATDCGGFFGWTNFGSWDPL